MSYNGDPSLERGLPKNIDAEKAVLGAILLKNALIQQASLRLKAGHFFLHSHRLLFVAMVTLASRNVPIDLVTLKAELERRGKFQQAGGAAYIASLIDGVPRTDDISHYVESVLEKAFLRKGVKVGADIIQKCIELEPFDSIREYAERTFAAISSEAVSSTSGVKFYSASEVAAQTPDEPVWIVKPYIACGAITEMAGKVKAAGKTTFLTHLCCAVVNGDRFLGEPTMKTAIVYLTEQPPNTFRVAMRRAGLLDREDFAVLFYHETKGLDWASVMKAARAECKRRDAKLVIVDTVSQFAGFRGEAENNTGDALVAVEPLQEAVAVDGLAVVASRHERKSGGEVGDSGRGSSAFSGAMDVVLSLRRAEGNANPNVRLIHALSRFDETPDTLAIELTESGYQALGSQTDLALRQARQALLEVTPRSPELAMRLDELQKAAGVRRTVAQEAVVRLTAEGRLQRAGAGRKGDPFRYYLQAEILSAANRDGVAAERIIEYERTTIG